MHRNARPRQPAHGELEAALAHRPKRLRQGHGPLERARAEAVRAHALKALGKHQALRSTTRVAVSHFANRCGDDQGLRRIRQRARGDARQLRAPHLGRQSKRFDDLGLREHRRRRPLTDRPQPAARHKPAAIVGLGARRRLLRIHGDALVAGCSSTRTRRHAGEALRCGLRGLRTRYQQGRAVAAVEPAAVRLDGIRAAHAHASAAQAARAVAPGRAHPQRGIPLLGPDMLQTRRRRHHVRRFAALRERRLADHLHAVGKGIALLIGRRGAGPPPSWRRSAPHRAGRRTKASSHQRKAGCHPALDNARSPCSPNRCGARAAA